MSYNALNYQEAYPSYLFLDRDLWPENPSEALLHKIITCESGWDPKACNNTYGCRGGMGLCQFISSTWNSLVDEIRKNNYDFIPQRCLQKVTLPVSKDKHEAVFDPECNLKMCRYLLNRDGDRHWRPYSGACYLK